jgi:excisionase family DNA binding protein
MTTSNIVGNLPNVGSVPEKFVSLKEAAAFLAVSPGFIYKWIHSIPHLKVGGPKSGKLLFRASELSAWVEHRREPTKASA